MDKFDFNIELDNHLKYYKLLIDGSNDVAEGIDKMVNTIISKKEKEDKLDKDDFIFIDSENIKLSIIQADVIKVVARLKLLYQLSFNLKIELSLSDKDKKILESIVASGGDFVFQNIGGKISFIDEEFSTAIVGNSYNKLSNIDLQPMYDELKNQYDLYHKEKDKSNGNKETDNK